MNCGLSCFLVLGLGAVSKLHSHLYLEKILNDLNRNGYMLKQGTKDLVLNYVWSYSCIVCGSP